MPLSVPRSRDNQHPYRNIQPREPVSPSSINSVDVGNRCVCEQNREGKCGTRFFRKHTSAIVADRQQALFGGTRNGESALHTPEDCHAAMQPAINVEIPCRYE